VVSQPDSPHTATYIAIAKQIWASLEGGAGLKPAPKIIFEA
jgi:hypothetical protein